MRNAIISFFFGLVMTTFCYAVPVAPLPVSVSAVDAAPNSTVEVTTPLAVNSTDATTMKADHLNGTIINSSSSTPSQGTCYTTTTAAQRPKEVTVPEFDGVLFIPIKIPGNVVFWWSLEHGRFVWADTLMRKARQFARRHHAKMVKRLRSMTPSQRIALADMKRIIRAEKTRKRRLKVGAMTFQGLENQMDEWLGEEGYADLSKAEKAEAYVAKTGLGRVLRKLPFCIATDVPALRTEGEIKKEKAEAKKKAKARRNRISAAIERRLNAEKKRVAQAQDYQVFPCLVQLDDAHGSHGGATLDGRNGKKKARVPMIAVDANGRHNAAVIKALHEINERRVALGLEKFKVNVTDIIFTEFRSGVDTTQLCALMEAKGYAPAGPGIFLRLRNKDNSPNLFTQWVLSEVVSIGQDLRSYGRSWTTSPALEIISHETPVFVVDMDSLGLITDGMSAFTQRLFETAAFQARLNTLPKDMREQILNAMTGKKEDLESTCIKGLFIGGKILWNVTEGRAEWVSKAMFREFEDVKDADGNTLGFNAGCPVVNLSDGRKYRAGIFVNNTDMAKGPAKKQFKSLAGNKVPGKGTELSGSNFFSFIIAEQYESNCSVGWQTLQLIHEKIVAKHADKFKDHIDSRISNIIERGIDSEIKDELSKSDGGVKVTKADGAALSLMQQMGGKGVGRLAFGGGLSCTMDYVLEWGDLPEGWAVHNPPAKIANKVDEAKDHYEMFQSRYPQQGFESLLYLKVLSATQLAKVRSNEWVTVCNWKDAQKKAFLKAQTMDKRSAQIKFLHAMFRKQTGTFDERAARVVKTLDAMIALLPFIKAGGCFLSHEDQFGKLRGDSDGDKNWWSYEPWLVAVVKEINEVVAELPIPRLEIQGSGMSLGANFCEKSYYDVIMDAKTPKKERLKLYNLICAANNGQGPVGLIANLSTVPLSRLNWDIIDGKMQWGTAGARELFAYWLLMQQTAIDAGKRIHPAPSLRKWEDAMLFKMGDDNMEALISPKDENDTKGHYRMLGKKETIWSMSTKFHMNIACFEEGLMYNEQCLSHWAAWVTNGLQFSYDFLANEKVMEEASKILGGGESSLPEFFAFVAEKMDVDVDVVTENWVMASDLISWKKGASLTEVNGVPAAGLGMIWQMVVDSYESAKTNAGLKGDPMEHFASLYKGGWKKIADSGIDFRYNYQDRGGRPRKGEFKIYLDPKDLAVLFRCFAALTDADSHEVSESERMQGDQVSSASDKKRIIREAFSHKLWDEHGSNSYYLATGKKKLSLELFVNNLFSQDTRWTPQRKKAATAAMIKCIVAAIAKLASDAGYASEAKGAEGWNYLIAQKLFVAETATFVTEAQDESQESMDAKLQKLGTFIDYQKDLLESEKYRKLTKWAARKDTCGMPTVITRGDLTPTITGRGWTTGDTRQPLFREFLKDLSRFKVNSQDVKIATWCADTMFPAFCEGFALADDLESRRTLINEPGLTQVDIDRAKARDPHAKLPTLGTAHTLSEDTLKEITMDRYSLKALLKFAGRQVHESRKAQAWVVDRIEEAFDSTRTDRQVVIALLATAEINIAKDQGADAWQLVIDAVMLLNTSRFYRKVRTQMRPLMGVTRMRNWHQRWAELYIEPKKRAAFVARQVDLGLFQVKVTKDADGVPHITDKWIRARLDFSVFPAWTGDFFGSALMADNDFAGVYLLVQEKNRARWTLFDSLTMRLGATQAKARLAKGDIKISATELCRQFVTLQVDPSNSITLGCAYHHMHYQSTMKHLTVTKADKSVVWKKFPTYADKVINGKVMHAFIEEQRYWLQGYDFGYRLKATKKTPAKESSCIVFLPYFFGANNKLATESDKTKWFISSKMWAALHSLGFMRHVPAVDGFSEASAMWQRFWGFEYPVKDRYRSDSDMSSDEASNMVAKQPMPYFNAELIKARDEHAGRVLAGVMHGYQDGHEKIGGQVYGFPSPQQCLAHVIKYYHSYGVDEMSAKDRIGLQKIVCGFLGLSSVEYQFENLSRGNVSEYTKYIARSWNGIRVSGLRDLFGALYVSEGWKVENSWFIGTREYGGNAKRIEGLISEFWSGDHNHPAHKEFSSKPLDGYFVFGGGTGGSPDDTSEFDEFNAASDDFGN